MFKEEKEEISNDPYRTLRGRSNATAVRPKHMKLSEKQMAGHLDLGHSSTPIQVQGIHQNYKSLALEGEIKFPLAQAGAFIDHAQH